MSLRNTGVQWQDEDMGLTLWMHPSDYFVQHILVSRFVDSHIPYDDTADETGDHTINNLRGAFLFIESFILDFECTDDSLPIVKYLKNRHITDLKKNYVLYRTMQYEDVKFIFRAYDETRMTNTTDEKKTTKKVSS